MTTPVLMSWSGGKDSSLALEELQADDRYEVVGLLTSVSEQYQRISHHGVREQLLDMQAEAIGLLLDKLMIPAGPCTNEQYERLMEDKLAGYTKRGVMTCAFGDIFLEDLRTYRERNLARARMSGLFPLWKRDPRELAKTFIARGYRAHLSCVEGDVGKRFAGRAFDASLLNDLPAGVDPCGENGEFHSFVCDGPIFRWPVPVKVGEVVTRDGRYYADLVTAGQQARGGGEMPPIGLVRGGSGFTLVELLVVIGIIAMLMAMLLPALNRARQQAQSSVCANNVRQLVMSCFNYANDYDGYWPPAHYNMWTKNLHRWHGERNAMNEPFDFSRSILKRYLQVEQIKKCPVFEPTMSGGFEEAAGGYGYNAAFIGSSTGLQEYWGVPMSVLEWERRVDNVPAKISQIRRASEKLVFADAAMGQKVGGAFSLIEYSFIEAPLNEWGASSPSLHFRHNGRANVGFADGHVSSEAFEWTYPTNIYKADNQALMLGFFGPRDNTLFQRD